MRLSEFSLVLSLACSLGRRFRPSRTHAKASSLARASRPRLALSDSRGVAHLLARPRPRTEAAFLVVAILSATVETAAASRCSDFAASNAGWYYPHNTYRGHPVDPGHDRPGTPCWEPADFAEHPIHCWGDDPNNQVKFNIGRFLASPSRMNEEGTAWIGYPGDDRILQNQAGGCGPPIDRITPAQRNKNQYAPGCNIVPLMRNSPPSRLPMRSRLGIPMSPAPPQVYLE